MIKRLRQKGLGQWVLLALTPLVFSIVLMGCSSANGEPEGEVVEGDWEGQSISVQMIGDWTMDDSTDPITGETARGVQVLKDEFEARYPGAEVEYVLMPWDNYVPQTQAMIASNELDVYQMPGIADFAAQGVLEPLQEYIDRDNFDSDIYIDGQMDGWLAMAPEDDDLQIYGLPVDGDSRFIVYDRQLFDEWDVEYLSDEVTMDEILDKAAQMTGENPVTGEQNYGVYFQGDWSTAFTLVNAAEGLGGTWGDGFRFEEMELNFNSDEMIEAMEWLNELKQYVPEGFVSAQGNEQWLTENNNIAISLNQGPAEIVQQVRATDLGDRLAITQEFSHPDYGMGGLFAGSPFAIAKESENKDLAWEYLKFTGSEFYQQFVFEDHGRVPVINAAFDWESVQEEEIMTPILESLGLAWYPRYPWASSEPRFTLQAEIENILTDQLSVEEGLNRAQEDSTQWLEDR